MKVHLLNYSDGQMIQHTSVLVLRGILSAEDIVHENENQEPQASFDLHNVLEISRNDSKESLLAYNSEKMNFTFLDILSEGINLFQFRNKLTNKIVSNLELSYAPAPTDYTVVILLVLCQNSKNVHNSISKNLKKINLGIRLIQSFFGEKLFEHSFLKRSFCIHEESPKVLKLELNSEIVSDMDVENLWKYLAKDIRSKKNIWNAHCKYIAFMADPWKPKNKSQENTNIALGGGGLALVGSDFLSVWPEDVNKVLETINNSEPLRDPNLLDSASRFGDIERTVGSLYAASLGGLAHEIGHIFDLGHTELGLMSSEFHRMKTFFTPTVPYLQLSSGCNSTDSIIRHNLGLPNSEIGTDFVSIGYTCATLLYFHRWFIPKSIVTSKTETSDPGPELQKNRIISKFELTAIQIRESSNGKVLKDWTFSINSPFSTKEFLLAKNHIPLECKTGQAQVVAQDTNGNILKAEIVRDMLPHSFTVIQRR